MPGSTRFILLPSCGLGGDGKKNLGTCLCVWVFCSCHIYESIWVAGDKDMHLGKQVVLQILSPG